MTGEETHIWREGVCLLMTQWPVPAILMLITPSCNTNHNLNTNCLDPDSS